MGGTALITGASSGLGVAFAHDLAARGYDVALTARSGATMETLAAELRQKHGVTATIHPMDMSEPGSASRLVKSLNDQGITPAVLVNNAGVGLNAKFIENDAARLAAMLQLNMIQPTELTQVLGRRMLERKSGHILFVASMAAYQPCPGMAAYGASKGYILSLGEALAVEFAPFIGVTVLSPGLMNTGFNAASGYKTSEGLERTILSTGRVAQIGLEAMFARRSGVIAGRLNAIMAFASRFVSRHTLAKQTQRMTADC
jgi:short-subunit dehydrogenase